MAPSSSLAWWDEQRNYWTNEVAINWNAALAYALGWLSYPND